MNVTHLVAAASASAIWLVVSHPIDVRLGPGDDARVNCAGPSRRISRTQHEYGVDDLHHALEVVHARVIADVGGRPAHHLAIVHIRVHVRIVCKEPRVDPACDVRGVLGRTVDHPGERVVEDGVGHGIEGASIVDRADSWVGLAIAIDLRACDPNYTPKKGKSACQHVHDGWRSCEKVRYPVVVSAQSYCPRQNSLAKSFAR